MKIITVLENTACRTDVAHAHGLSLYAETAAHKILFDMGPSADVIGNARTLGIDLAAVDIAVLSHGHYDHAGGLAAFLRENSRAAVYVRQGALEDYYAAEPNGETRYIGVPQEAKAMQDRLTLTGELTVVDASLRIFSDVKTADYRSHTNDSLLKKQGEAYPMDDFAHEQSLLIEEGGKAVLLAGCAHRGIVNILRRAEELLGRAPDAVFAGLHLSNPGAGGSEPRELVEAVGRELAERRQTVYYTGHCTGETAFAILKERMGPQLQAMTGGRVVEL